MKTKAYPHVGINHPVAKIVSYRKMTVSQEEYELVIQHRKDKIQALRPTVEGLTAYEEPDTYGINYHESRR